MSARIELIVNADDYGRTPGVSKGIREAHRRGIITSTTAMMNMPAVDEELRRAREETPELGLGVHLVLTSGFPLLPPEEVSTITAWVNTFPSLQALLPRIHTINPCQALAEWDAQIRRFIHAIGAPPDHLDSHHHITYFSEPLLEAFFMLADRYGCAVRMPTPSTDGEYSGLPTELLAAAREYFPRQLGRFDLPRPDVFLDSFYNETATEAHLRKLLAGLQPGVSELMCHPGYADAPLIEGSAYNRQREIELGILTSDAIRSEISTRAILLRNFQGLRVEKHQTT